MRIGTIVRSSFIASFLITMIGAYQKILHAEYAEIYLIVGVIASLVFIVSAIYEVQTSTQFRPSEKTMWTVGLIFMGGIVGLVYLLKGRKRVAKHSSPFLQHQSSDDIVES